MNQLLQLALHLMKLASFWVEVRLNYLDLITFCVGALIIFIIFFSLLKRKNRLLSMVSKKYEEELKSIKECHLGEIHKAQLSIRAFKEELENIEASYTQNLEKQGQEFQESIKESEKQHAKRIQEVEKGHQQAHSVADLSVFELRKEMGRVRAKQLDEVKAFQNEVEKLKEEISSLHENHARQIEQSEMEIKGLRKQLRVLMYKV